MNHLTHLALPVIEKADISLSKLHSPAMLAARLYLANVFFSAGLTKLRDWDSTLFLFAEEYQVPLLPYELAAWLGTAGELLFPILLVLGLFSRLSALALFVVNLVAVISLPEIATAALYLHVIWGILLLQTAVYGGGLLALDTLLGRSRHRPAMATPH
ncbi:MAG: DoxX family protein [Pseudomonadota bacterium]|nr:DoxX family protein [Pseudomonadota bacterium]